MSIERCLKVLVVLCTSVMLLALQPAAASAASLGPYIITSGHKCLEVPGAGATTPELQLVSQNCFGNRVQWQQWFFVETSGGYYQLKNVKTLQCATRRHSVFTEIVQGSCVLANAANEWKPINREGNLYRLQNKASGLCLFAGSPGTNQPITQISCSSAPLWTWVA